jgi:hypothetical protein
MLSKNKKMYLVLYVIGTALLILSLMMSASIIKALALG